MPTSPQPTAEYARQCTLIRTLYDQLRQQGKHPRLLETHISWVLLVGSEAWKIKKAINPGFLDYTHLESRQFCCEEEIRLNGRLAPELYLDVLPIGGSPEQPVPGQRPVIEYAVRMRRFPEAQLMSQQLAHGLIAPEQIEQLALLLAQFHRQLPPAGPDSPYGSAESVHAIASDNCTRLHARLSGSASGKVAALQTAFEAEYRRCQSAFRQRHAAGFIRECHGDLHLGNVVLLDGQLLPFDGIEFAPALRWIDPLDEIAFLVMDLQRHNQPGFASLLLNTYLESSGDYAGLVVFRYYLAHRAAVRATISAMRKRWADCHAYLQLALNSLTTQQAALIITHGLPGSGKTRFAQEAMQRLPAIRIRSDVERLRRFANQPNRYSQEATRQTFTYLYDLAHDLLGAGMNVIVDAAFLRFDERQQFRQLADELACPFAIAALEADDSTLRERIAQRQHEGRDASEANLAVLEMLRGVAEPLTQAEQVVVFQNNRADFVLDTTAWQALLSRLRMK